MRSLGEIKNLLSEKYEVPVAVADLGGARDARLSTGQNSSFLCSLQEILSNSRWPSYRLVPPGSATEMFSLAAILV